MKINIFKSMFGTQREREELESLPVFEKRRRIENPHTFQGTSPASREQKRRRLARRITRRHNK